MIQAPVTQRTATSTRIVFWPCLVDMLTSVLMIFLLVYFIQATLGQKDFEAELIRQKQADFVDLFKQTFATEISNHTVAITNDLNLVQITFSDRILFPSRQYQLQDAGKDALRRCAILFTKSHQPAFKQIQVEGHTDRNDFHSFEYPRDNWELSAGRAITVVKFLVEQGLPENLLSANGYAATKPIAPGDSEQDLARNRRIELRIVFSVPGQGKNRQ